MTFISNQRSITNEFIRFIGSRMRLQNVCKHVYPRIWFGLIDLAFIAYHLHVVNAFTKRDKLILQTWPMWQADFMTCPIKMQIRGHCWGDVVAHSGSCHAPSALFGRSSRHERPLIWRLLGYTLDAPVTRVRVTNNDQWATKERIS